MTVKFISPNAVCIALFDHVTVKLQDVQTIILTRHHNS